MGLLDSLIGNVAGSLLGGGGAQGGGQGQVVQMLLGMLTQGGGDGAQGGGLGGLLSKMNEAGLGQVAQSWIGSGQNLPISAEQISQVLGSDTLSNLAQQLGMDHGQITSHLSELLPHVVDTMTPNGQMPQGGSGGGADLAGMATQILGQFLKR